MKLSFTCPKCDSACQIVRPGLNDWQCPNCSTKQILPAAQSHDGGLKCCAYCGNEQLYRKKDFPHWLGMTLLTVACALFFIFAVRYQYAIAWGILLGSAAIDGLLYLYVGDVVVCYRCGAQHRGVPSRTFDPHELAIAERYRQERLRKEQLKSNDAAVTNNQLPASSRS